MNVDGVDYVDGCEQRIAQAVVALGWLREEHMRACLLEKKQGDGSETLLECYLSEENIINGKQLEHLTLYRNLPDSIAGYKIVDVIGAGAMGVVYLVDSPEHSGLALKVVNKKHCDDEEFIRRFERESEAVSNFTHENIVSAEGSGTYRGQLYLATEYVDGPGLDEILGDYGALPEAYVLHVIGQVVRGLKHAYDTSGIVHRDVKPANILIDHQGAGLDDHQAADASQQQQQKGNLNIYPGQDIAKIIDFGLAKRTDDTDNLTITGLTVGTPHYMAPEQIRADRDIDSRVDMYSVGATMYHLLTGQTPYVGNSPGGIMLAHVNDIVPDPSDIIPSLKPETIELVMCSLEKKKENRYTDYNAFLMMVEAAQQACSDKESDIQLLRKPLKMVSGVTHKKPVSPYQRTRSEEQRVLTPDQASAQTVMKDRSDFIGEPVVPVAPARRNVNLRDSHPSLTAGKSSGSLRRLLNYSLFSVEKSAVNDADMQDHRSSISPLLWIVLGFSIVFLIVAVSIR